MQPPPSQPPLAAPRQSKKIRWILFAVGFVAFFVINSLGLAVLNFVPNYLNGQLEFLNPLVSLTGWLCLLFDLVLISVLSFIPGTRWFAFGFLTAMALSFVISLILAIFVLILCFAQPNLP
jgi:hypothetical protein